MKNSEKSSSKVNNNNNNNNNVLSPETIKAQLKAACANMNAAQTKEYIKGLDGYSIKQTGANPDRTHATIYFGDMRVCNVENVQGITADGTARGCISVAKINFFEKVDAVLANYKQKLCNEDELKQLDELDNTWTDVCCRIEKVLKAANKRASDEAKEAAKAKREAAAKERAQNKMNNKLKESSDNEKIAALAAVLDISFDEAKIIFEKKRAQKTA